MRNGARLVQADGTPIVTVDGRQRVSHENTSSSSTGCCECTQPCGCLDRCEDVAIKMPCMPKLLGVTTKEICSCFCFPFLGGACIADVSPYTWDNYPTRANPHFPAGGFSEDNQFVNKNLFLRPKVYDRCTYSTTLFHDYDTFTDATSTTRCGCDDNQVAADYSCYPSRPDFSYTHTGYFNLHIQFVLVMGTTVWVRVYIAGPILSNACNCLSPVPVDECSDGCNKRRFVLFSGEAEVPDNWTDACGNIIGDNIVIPNIISTGLGCTQTGLGIEGNTHQRIASGGYVILGRGLVLRGLTCPIDGYSPDCEEASSSSSSSSSSATACPGDCSTCPATKTVTVSGGTGADGAYVLNQTGAGLCAWQYTSGLVTIDLICDGSDWKITYTDDGTGCNFIARRPNISGCPADGAYTLDTFAFCGGTPVVSVS